MRGYPTNIACDFPECRLSDRPGLCPSEGRRLDSAARDCHIHTMTDPTKLTLEEIEADLEISEAQAARGETVPLEPVLQRLRDSIARMEARQSAAHARKA